MKRMLQSKWFRALLVLTAAGSLLFGLLLSVVLYGSYDHIQGQPQTMIILGCQIHPWGPSVLLKDRLDVALDYLDEHPEVTVIVSGGQGPDEHTSEAACMQDYLVKAGISPERVIVEELSHNTYQNIIYSAQVMGEQGLDMEQGVLIVSNGFHLTRARMLWDRVTEEGEHLSTLAAPSSHTASRIWMYIREPLALVKSFVFDR